MYINNEFKWLSSNKTLSFVFSVSDRIQSNGGKLMRGDCVLFIFLKELTGYKIEFSG